MTAPSALVLAWRARAFELRAWAAAEGAAAALEHAADELEAVIGGYAPARERFEGHGGNGNPLASSSWRDRLWTVPPETRLGVAEVAEATGRSRDWVYRHTAPGGIVRRLPHRKLDGELVFLAGELRDWLTDAEAVIESGVRRLHAIR